MTRNAEQNFTFWKASTQTKTPPIITTETLLNDGNKKEERYGNKGIKNAFRIKSAGFF